MITLYNNDRYHVDTSRLGDARITRWADSASVYFQAGDDASSFLADFELAQSSFGDKTERMNHWLSQYDDVM